MVARLSSSGEEIPDPKPMEVPAGFKEPESLEQLIRRLVHSEDLRKAADSAEVDNWEDAEDFIIPEEGDFDPSTPYEEVFDPQLGRGITPQEFHERAEYYKQKYIEAEERAMRVMMESDALRRVPTKVTPPRSPPPEGEGRGGEGSPPQVTNAPKEPKP